MKWRTHRFIKAIYVMSGTGRVLIENDEFRFRPRDVILVPPGKKNRIVDDRATDVSLYVLCIDRGLVRFDSAIESQLPIGRLRSSVHFANRVQSQLRRLLFAQTRSDRLGPLNMVGDALSLLSLLARQPVQPLPQEKRTAEADEITSYVRHLKNHFFEATTIDEAADRLGLSRRRFTTLFRQQTGDSWLEHIRGLRIDHAKSLLKGSDLPIASVAFECGYDDISTFYRQFKRQTGLAPGVWRDS